MWDPCSNTASVDDSVPAVKLLTCREAICPDCLLETVVILESSDGVQFGTHSNNLEVYSHGFPAAAFASQSVGHCDVVHMEENSKVVKLLLQYMHLMPQPILKIIPFNVLEQLANAAEKYLVYPAMGVCLLRMESKVSDHPFAVLKYAAKHKYNDLADQAAPLTLGYEWETTGEEKTHFRYCWLEYWAAWMKVVISVHEKTPRATQLHKGGSYDCDAWNEFHAAVLKKFGFKASALLQIGTIMDSEEHVVQGCSKCWSRSWAWRADITSRIDQIRPFSSFL